MCNFEQTGGSHSAESVAQQCAVLEGGRSSVGRVRRANKEFLEISAAARSDDAAIVYVAGNFR